MSPEVEVRWARRVAIVLAIVAALAWLAAPTIGAQLAHRPCAVVAPDADAQGPFPTDVGPLVGADYRSGTWHTSQGSIVGYSATEDSTVWNRRGCDR